MFSKGKDKIQSMQRNRQRSSGPVSLISPNLTITGNLSTQGDLQIDGTVEGNIQCHSLTLGASAKVKGHISATEVLIRGALIGDIEAQTVTLSKTARVTGDILHQTVSIEPGATLEGRIAGRSRIPTVAKPTSPHTAPMEILDAAHQDQIQRIPRQIN